MLFSRNLPALSAHESRLLDQRAIRDLRIPAHSLMENAGNALARFCLRAGVEPPPQCVVILCGTGNNGGDGLACARHLWGRVADVRVFILGSGGDFRSEEALLNLRLLAAVASAPVEISSSEALRAQLPAEPWIGVDCVFGTGLTRQITGFRAECLDLYDRKAAFKVAADIPSGLCADSGQVLGIAPRCDATITFMTANKGHLIPSAAPFVGKLLVEPIGLPPTWIEEVLRSFPRPSCEES